MRGKRAGSTRCGHIALLRAESILTEQKSNARSNYSQLHLGVLARPCGSVALAWSTFEELSSVPRRRENTGGQAHHMQGRRETRTTVVDAESTQHANTYFEVYLETLVQTFLSPISNAEPGLLRLCHAGLESIRRAAEACAVQDVCMSNTMSGRVLIVWKFRYLSWR